MNTTFLSAMDIQVWIPRHTLPNAKKSPGNFSIYSLQYNAQEIGYLLLENISFGEYGEKVIQLMDAMLAAIHFKRGVELSANIKWEEKKVLILGFELAEKLLDFSLEKMRNNSENILPFLNDIHSLAVTSHPYKLLIQPQDKRKAWMDLQAIAKSWLNEKNES